MSKEIKVTIDGIECVANEGEYILNIARANNIFIPALCYLTRCSPTLACRICLVEADGKRVYSCNVKAKDGMDIVTNNDEIATERRAIMEVYDVNHPLQCGVCDKSGECELQNYSLYHKIDSQSYAIADTTRQVKDWSSVLHYDPALCIVCERCSTVCKDMIGEAALKTTKRGGDTLPKELKEQMPKDAYAMWNKLQKSIISPSNGESTDCADCGECISVCPTGAIVSRDFQYKTNAWELTKVPATCAHCSVGCQLNYEVKHTDIQNPQKKIYRVTNEFHYVSLCGAGRFGYDFENRATKDEEAFDAAIEALQECDTIIFDSFITNEEALLLQKIKEKLGVKLVNQDAKRFQNFMQTYSSVSGKNLYSGDLKSVFASDFVISVGTFLRSDSPNSRYAFNNVQKLNKGAGVYFHPIKDNMVETFGKSVMQINHKPGLEDAVLYLILHLFGKDLPQQLAQYIKSFEYEATEVVTETIKEEIVETKEEVVVDEQSGEERRELVESKKLVPKKIEKEVQVTKNRLMEIVEADSDFEAKLEKALKKKENFSLIVGEDLILHDNAQELAKLVAAVECYTDFNVVVIPPRTNTLGVSLICDLDENIAGKTVGYNSDADFVLSSVGGGDLDMPALNQQEGTFTNINKKVVPTNAALEYDGYCLNDLANALGIENEQTVDLTADLPKDVGFKPINFDDLPLEYNNDQSENRGYALTLVELNTAESTLFAPIATKQEKAANLYRANPVVQFNEYTKKAHEIADSAKLYCSQSYAKDLGVNDGESIRCIIDKVELDLVLVIDNKIDGDIVYLPDFDRSIQSDRIFSSSRYCDISIVKG